ncbi:hypothetical protein ACFL1G_09160 [Planctomycetota bacterium]
MLSFLKEQGAEKSSQPSFASNGEAGVDNGEQKDNQQYLTVATDSDNVRRSTILLTVLFLAGLLFLFFMIKKSSPTTVSASSISLEELQIEKAIAELTGVRSKIFNRMDEIVKKFYEFSNVEQVAVDELVKNPFRYKMFTEGAEKASDSKNMMSERARILREQLKQQAKELELLGIVRSDGKTCCMIDQKILYEGDLIKVFKISQIGSNFVKLTPAQNEFAGTKPGELEIVLKLFE